ncbi:SUMF1/EgtB/PvdO family nonheme iron enzyme [Oscillatoria sp. HE19RPO]|uniref:formylglycine-generating enzyme family protein n=1 Tax=Oscillatoria sp. HE19RPO TaxID=2954806 RepID=UPI0020C206F0|nr:SUMF1/EgtB/PvdO family nonheme iron enzyme [Oscillatoria sp. HE19RPO]
MDINLENYFQLDLKSRQNLTLEILSLLEQDFELLEMPSHNNLLPTFINSKTGLIFKYIFGGTFNMGFSEEEERQAKNICNPIPANLNEMRPVTPVTVKSFLISIHPILNNLYWKLFNIKRTKKDFTYYPAYLTREQAKKLLADIGFRLPYEQEWEYVCRATTKTLFNFGDKLIEDQYLFPLLNNNFYDLTKLTPNLFGLYGIFTGEWCEDEYRFSYEKNSPKEQGSYVVRGGGSIFWPWQDEEWVWCMSAMRMPSKDLIDGTCGVRLVFDINF